MKRLLIISAVILAFPVEAQILDTLVSNGIVSDTLQNRQIQALDLIQIEAAQYYSKLKNHYDSVEQKYSALATVLVHQIDSLNEIKLPANHHVQKQDSINQVKKEKLSTINTKVEKVKASTIDKIGQLNLPPGFKTKINAYTASIDQLDLSLSTSNLQIPPLNATDNIKSPIAEGIPNLSTTIPHVDEVTQTATQLQELNQVVPKDITSPDQLVKAAESQVTQIKEVGVVQEQLGNVPINSLSSEDQAKQQLLNQAKEAAVDHFAGKDQELKEAMALVSKYKKKYGSFNSLEDIMKRRPNEMNGKPLIERIVPGILFQIQKKNDELLVDFNPYAGYRVTGKLTAGLGWNYRVSYHLNNNAFNEDARIYGPRIFTEYKLWKGFSPRAEVETMNTFVPPFARTSPVDLGSRQWVWGVFAGVKKDYKFLKKINGTALVMVRLFDPQHKSPYADVINARFGFACPP